MKKIILMALLAAFWFSAPVMAADIQVFPPENSDKGACSGEDHALTWNGVGNVKCKSISELLAALSDCPAGQVLVVDSAGTGLECKATGNTNGGTFIARFFTAKSCDAFWSGNLACSGSGWAATCRDIYYRQGGNFTKCNYYYKYKRPREYRAYNCDDYYKTCGINPSTNSCWSSNLSCTADEIVSIPENWEDGCWEAKGCTASIVGKHTIVNCPSGTTGKDTTNSFVSCPGMDIKTGDSATLLVKQGDNFMSGCITPHPDTQKCSCPSGSSPVLVASTPVGGLAGGAGGSWSPGDHYETYMCQ